MKVKVKEREKEIARFEVEDLQDVDIPFAIVVASFGRIVLRAGVLVAIDVAGVAQERNRRATTRWRGDDHPGLQQSL